MRRRVATVGNALAGAVILALCSSAEGPAYGEESLSVKDIDGSVDIAEWLHSLIEENPGTYGGAYSGSEGKGFVLLVVPQPGIRVEEGPINSILARSLGLDPLQPFLSSISIRVAKYGWDELQSTFRQIHEDVTAGRVKYGPLGYVIGSEQNRVVVSLEVATKEAVGFFNQRYGDIVQVVEAPPFDDLASRTGDSDPYYGGLRIPMGDPAASPCSTAFNVVRSNTRYGLTAGHCGVVSTVVYHNGYPIGDLYSRFDNSEADSALIKARSGSWGSRVYYGSPASGTSAPVKDVSTNELANSEICVDGAITGTVCHVKVMDSSPGCFPFRTSDGRTLNRCNIVRAQRAGYVVGQAGDSGAPIYQVYHTSDKYNESLKAYGLLIGGMSPGGDIVAFQPMRIVLKMQSASIISSF